MGRRVAATSVPACWVRPPIPALGDVIPINLTFSWPVQNRRDRATKAKARLPGVVRGACGIRDGEMLSRVDPAPPSD